MMITEEAKSLKHIHAKSALLPQGWAKEVRISWHNGLITAVTPDAPKQPDDETHDIVLPGVANLHSHAFQRAMAGLAETRGANADSFWSWRKTMYDLALKVSADDVGSIACQLYMEMLEAGFTQVGEFHYLHHNNDGHCFANIAEMATHIAAASVETGMRLTLLPVFYAHAGFGGLPPHEGQRRFVNSLDQFEKLVQASKTAIAGVRGANMGLAPHSLRAVTPDELKVIVEMAADLPIHIHVAEQTQEVADCVAWSGTRPVTWLLDHAPVAKNWCLIHATHMTEIETRRLAQTAAVVGLCPITEANLGDGIFPAQPFTNSNGAFGIGSDSNVHISLSSELRQLEYSQRLANHARNVLAAPGMSNGRCLFDKALRGGASSLGSTAGLAVGRWADMVSLDLSSLPILKEDKVLDHWVFSEGYKVDCVWAMGMKQVVKGKHRLRETIQKRFIATMQDHVHG
jgi:formimidoylglutamate deiminase